MGAGRVFHVLAHVQKLAAFVLGVNTYHDLISRGTRCARVPVDSPGGFLWVSGVSRLGFWSDDMKSSAERFEVSSGKRSRFEPTRILLQDTGLWAGVHLEVWESDGEELPEIVLPQDAITVNDVSCSSEVRFSGERPYVGGWAPHRIGLLPAHLPYSATGGPVRLVVLGLGQNLLKRWRPTAALVPKFGVEDEFLRATCYALAKDAADGHPEGAMYGDILIAALGAHLVRNHSTDARLTIEDPWRSTLRQEIIEEYIRDQLHERISLADLAALIDLDVYSFAKWFRKTFGRPPHQYLLKLRIERAKVLLWSSADSLVSIAFKCGFNSQSHLSTTFHRFVGLSPRTYRLLRRNDGASREAFSEC